MPSTVSLAGLLGLGSRCRRLPRSCWSELNPPRRPKVVALHGDNVKSTLLDYSANVSVPPASVLVGVRLCQRIQDSVQPPVVRPAVLEE